MRLLAVFWSKEDYSNGRSIPLVLYDASRSNRALLTVGNALISSIDANYIASKPSLTKSATLELFLHISIFAQVACSTLRLAVLRV